MGINIGDENIHFFHPLCLYVAGWFKCHVQSHANDNRVLELEIYIQLEDCSNYQPANSYPPLKCKKYVVKICANQIRNKQI
jgi:hypothetical protein